MSENGPRHTPTQPVFVAQGSELRPVPDPTALTTEALQREIKGLGEILRSEMEGDRKALLEKFAAIALEFNNVKERFDLAERQRVEQKQDTEKAVQAALLAQKEAVKEQTAASQLSIAKSETGVKEQSSQQYATVTAQLTAITDKIGVLTSRVGTIEAVKIGAVETRTGQQSSVGMIAGAVATAVAVISVLITVAVLLTGP